MAETQLSPEPKKSDLGTRAASAVVMVAVAGTALWLGGWWWTVFVAAVALGVLWEWYGLVSKFAGGFRIKALWLVGGLIYIGLAAMLLAALRGESESGLVVLLMIVVGVIGTDIGAYFTGRTFGGPKIAPSISPSKTWSGLLGGMLGAGLGIWIIARVALGTPNLDSITFTQHGIAKASTAMVGGLDFPTMIACLLIGATLAVAAQAGDFFESWMKRRAGVKDSGKLIPGHGGLFDRADGMIAVLFVLALFNLSVLKLPL